MDRNCHFDRCYFRVLVSLSARRAWIEISGGACAKRSAPVALRKESVDRNIQVKNTPKAREKSLSARRAWIEIGLFGADTLSH